MNELLKASKYMQRELWNLSFTPIRECVAIDDESTLEALDAVQKAYIVFSDAIEKAEACIDCDGTGTEYREEDLE